MFSKSKDNLEQKDNVRAMVFWGHAPNSQTRLPEMAKAMEKLDLLVVVDPYPTMSAVMSEKKDGLYLLPACTQFETYGSVTASNRSIQWREKVVDPLFESLPDHTIMAKFAKKFGFEKEFFKNIKVNDKDEPLIEDITREFNKWYVDDRVHRPVAGAYQGAHGKPASLRQDHSASEGWSARW